MTKHLDIDGFIRTTGSIRVLATVAKIFLIHSDLWSVAIKKYSNPFDAQKLFFLVHKMKGSCYTVFAMDVAAELAQVEACFPEISVNDWPAVAERLLGLVSELNLELEEVVVATNPKFPQVFI
jgi:homoserine acetyltransferase